MGRVLNVGSSLWSLLNAAAFERSHRSATSFQVNRPGRLSRSRTSFSARVSFLSSLLDPWFRLPQFPPHLLEIQGRHPSKLYKGYLDLGDQALVERAPHQGLDVEPDHRPIPRRAISG